jgi:hypothetical protein
MIIAHNKCNVTVVDISLENGPNPMKHFILLDFRSEGQYKS